MSESRFAHLPTAPYYAVIFTSQRNTHDPAYDETGERMLALATAQPGYLGGESVRDAEGFGITISYWESQQAIAQWRAHAEHRVAQENGKRDWYEHYQVRVALVERAWALC